MKRITIKKNIFIITIITLIIIIFSEICLRIFVFSLTGKKDIFFYGNQKVFIKILDLSELNFFVETVNKNKHSFSTIKIIDKNSALIHTYGGSTTYGHQCDFNNWSSWPENVEKISNYTIENFARNGMYSKESLQILKKNLENKSPNILIWAHKFNEHNYIYLGGYKKEQIKKKSKKIILELDSTMKKYSLLYFILDEFIKKLSLLIGGFPEHIEGNDYTENDFKIIIDQYYKNTEEAIIYSKSKGVDFFYIVILPSLNFPNKKYKNFYDNYFLEKVINLSDLYNIRYLDLNKYFENKDNSFYCDDMHVLPELTQLISFEIKKFLER
tara:strand:- start:214 stop:1194 length:981 start_codon:yes stop_codon:yes gene_type:complete